MEDRVPGDLDHARGTDEWAYGAGAGHQETSWRETGLAPVASRRHERAGDTIDGA